MKEENFRYTVHLVETSGLSFFRSQSPGISKPKKKLPEKKSSSISKMHTKSSSEKDLAIPKKLSSKDFSESTKQHLFSQRAPKGREPDILRFLLPGNMLSIKKLTKAVFRENSGQYSFQSSQFRTESSKVFSEVRRLSRERTDQDTHKILSLRTGLANLNI